MFVAVEGLDGVGKTTLVKALAEYHDGEAANTPGPVLREADASDPSMPLATIKLQGACSTPQAFSRKGNGRGRSRMGAVAVFMDRYWLSTIAYARARGVSVDLSSLEAIIPVPDITVLLVLDEPERLRRLDSRGATDADVETLDNEFRETVLHEMRSRTRPFGQWPLEVDVTGASEREALRKVLAVLPNGKAQLADRGGAGKAYRRLVTMLALAASEMRGCSSGRGIWPCRAGRNLVENIFGHS